MFPSVSIYCPLPFHQSPPTKYSISTSHLFLVAPILNHFFDSPNHVDRSSNFFRFFSRHFDRSMWQLLGFRSIFCLGRPALHRHQGRFQRPKGAALAGLRGFLRSTQQRGWLPGRMVSALENYNWAVAARSRWWMVIGDEIGQYIQYIGDYHTLLRETEWLSSG